MVRILQIVPNMQAGGLETFIMNVYRNIDRSKVQFDFLVNYKEKKFYDDEIEKLGGKIYRFSLRNDNNIIKYIKDLDKFFKEHKEYKVIHCHMASIGFIIFWIAKKNGVKIRIAHSHNTNTENTLKGHLKRILIKPYKNLSTENFACSKEAGKFLFKNKKFEVIPNSIELEKFKYNEEYRKEIRNELSLQEDNLVYGHVGRFCKQKNHRFLIEIFESIVNKNPKARLVLVGTGELGNEIKQLVKNKKIDDKVIFLGNRSDVNKIYSAIDCFIFPSKFEGLGIVLVEAQTAGLKCICSDIIPEEAKICDLYCQKSLKSSADEWAFEAMNLSKIDRKKYYEYAKKSNYDIKKLAKNLEFKYLKMNEED